MRQSPYVNRAAPSARRNYALDRMADEGFITAGTGRRSQGEADFVRAASRSEVRSSRRTSSRKCASTSSRSTAPRRSTRAASRSDRARHPAAAGRQPGGRSRGCAGSTSAAAIADASRNVLAQGQTLDRFRNDRWTRPIAEGDIVPAVDRGVTDAARVRIGATHAELTWRRHRSGPQDIAGDCSRSAI